MFLTEGFVFCRGDDVKGTMVQEPLILFGIQFEPYQVIKVGGGEGFAESLRAGLGAVRGGDMAGRASKGRLLPTGNYRVVLADCRSVVFRCGYFVLTLVGTPCLVTLKTNSPTIPFILTSFGSPLGDGCSFATRRSI